MAKERLQPISLHQEMQRSYLEYAMSVIVGRALPDARDGLKPVQRRILYAMHELGLTPDRPYRKCARVVGDVLGKYHPHGDQAVYDALVRLVQNFSSRYPILDGHGNFGSVDDDPPAAMRYTETRLAAIANEGLLDEIGSETVEFSPNFDGSQQEPIVLPAQLPFLLLNGCSGIAVGMATSIPPHNLNEIVDGIIALIKKPDIDDNELLKIIPGPDFPTGGEILIGTGIRETYLKGRGSIPMRGMSHIEEIHPGKGKHKRTAIIVTELPYQLSKAGWIEKLAEYVNEGKIAGIADIRDESDRDGMRIVVELRRDSDPEKILGDLHRRTSLQSNFGAILLALVDGQPKQLSLRRLLETFIEFRENTVIRRTNYALSKSKERLLIVEGLLKALKNLRVVIDMLERAKDSTEAKAKLMVNLDISEKQADSVLSMPLRKLTGLEQTSLNEERKALKVKNEELEALLNDRKKLLNTIIQELKNTKKKFGNPRKSRLIEGGDELVAERNASLRPSAELQKKQAYDALASDSRLLIQNDNQVKIVSPQLLGKLHLEKNCGLNSDTVSAKLILPIEINPLVIALTDTGRIALLKWEFAGQQPGTLEKFLPGGLEGEKVVNLLAVSKDENRSLGLLSSDGRFKRIKIKDVLDLSGRAATILKLKDGVKLKSAMLCSPKGCICLISNIGRILKIEITNESFPIQGKLAQGALIMKLFPNEQIINAISYDYDLDIPLIIGSKLGNIYTLDINKIRSCVKGQLGSMVIDLKSEGNSYDEISDVCKGNTTIGIISSKGRSARIDTKLLKDDTKNSFKLTLHNDEFLESFVPLINKETINRNL